MENLKTDKQKNTYSQNVYDDGNIPDVDLPKPMSKQYGKDLHMDYESVEPLPESSRPRKDGPGGGE